MITKNDVMKVLEKCYDPEVPINIVDLGLIYDVKVEKNNVNVKMTLTSSVCPLADMLKNQVAEKIKEMKGAKKVNVQIVWDPPWTPERMKKAARHRLGL